MDNYRLSTTSPSVPFLSTIIRAVLVGMNELRLPEVFLHRLRATTTHFPGAMPHLPGSSLTAQALRAATASWEHSLLRAAEARQRLLGDLTLFCSRAQATDESMAQCLR